MSDAPFSDEPVTRITNPPKARWAPKLLLGLVLALFLAVVLWKVGYLNGGRERKRASFYGFSSSSRGFSLGSKNLYVRAGQSVVVDYNFEAGKGNLMLLIRRDLNSVVVKGGNADAIWTHHVYAPGQSTLRVPIAQNDLYKISIVPHPERGETIVYDVRWRVE
jgi:hypothetical protein